MHRHQRAGPEQLVGVRHGRTHRHRPGIGVDGVLDHAHLTGRLARIAGNHRLDGRGLVGERLAQVRQAALGQREGDIDRRRLNDGSERGVVCLASEIADLDGGHAHAPADLGADGAIAELDFQVFDHRLVGLHRTGEDADLGPGIVEIGHRRGAFADQFGIALDVALGAFERGLVTRELPFDLADLRFDRAPVHGEQQIACPHRRTVAEMHADDFAVDPGLDRDTGNWRDSPE